MSSGFDAAAAVRAAQKRRADHETQQAKAAAAHRKWVTACQAVLNAFNERNVRAVAELYQEHGYGFWLDFQECLLIQEQTFCKRCGKQPDGERQAYWTFALNLMKSAVLPQATNRVTEVLKEIEQLNIKTFVCSALKSLHDDFRDWETHFPPTTPLLRRTDLAEACKLGRLDGYYPMARITERIQAQSLQVFDEQVPQWGRRSPYACFRDVDSDAQRKILRSVVGWVRRKMKPEDSFSGGLWITETST